MRILAFLFGLILLLPGACSLGFMVVLIPNELKSTYSDPYLSIAAILWAFCFLISFGGVLMIRNAMRVEPGERAVRGKRGEGPRTGGPRTGDPPAKRD